MKKAICVLVILTGLASTLYGQEKRLKQVEKDIREHIQPDTLRVNRLNELPGLTLLSVGRLDTLGTEALSISQKLHYEEGEAEAYITLARVSYYKNNMAEAHRLLQKAISLSEKLPDKSHLSNAWSYSSSLNNLTGESQKALADALKAEEFARTTQDKSLISKRQTNLASIYANSFGDYTRAMEWAVNAEKNAEESNDLNQQAQSWSSIATVYTQIGDQANALAYYQKALDANKKLGNENLEFNLLNRIGEMYRLTGKYKEALKAYEEGLSKTALPYNTELTESNIADVYVRLGNFPLAYKYAFKSLHTAQEINDVEGEEWIDGILARGYLKRNMPDSAIYYAKTGYANALKTGTLEFKRDNTQALTNAYAMKKDYANAYKYQLQYSAYRDSMQNTEVTSKANLLQYNYNLAKKQTQITSLSQEKKMQYYFLAGSAGILLIIGTMGVILLRNNRQKQKANQLLRKQKKEIEDQRDQTNKALGELQQTQAQLIQREKMASLGELTAGIAHEIQNPLNFVNNFSEVSIELLEELKEAEAKGNMDDIEAIAADLSQNLEKIRQHGKRADGIVKGMLQHSRTVSGQKEPTDLNTIADEYLRLAYHGLRAKDKSFNAELVTHFDEKLPKVEVVPQDIGRVVLNLVNNAFYATQEKTKSAGAGYKPTVEVSTSRVNGSVQVVIKDNGNGIPANIREKIMQPFFTTKPTGEGTGLGLSLSYDIVVKGHQGAIAVDTKPGAYTEFTVTLPIN